MGLVFIMMMKTGVNVPCNRSVKLQDNLLNPGVSRDQARAMQQEQLLMARQKADSRPGVATGGHHPYSNYSGSR